MKVKKIAVVGSGISGLSAAWLLSQRHDVTLIEADKRIGGHSNTVDCRVGDGKVAVDTGFIVYNNATYPNLSSLFQYLNVPVTDSSMGFAVSLDAGRYEYSGAGLKQLVGHASNLGRLKHWRMMADLTRFFRSAPSHADTISEHISLRQYVQDENYSQAFLELHLLPVAGAIWSADPQQMLDYPARAFLRFFDNHGLLKFIERPQWRTVKGGSREYVQRLLDDSKMRVVSNCAVNQIDRTATGVVVRGAGGYAEAFDDVVIATHADSALDMLKPSQTEAELLSTFKYSQNQITLHEDESFMPRRKNLWSSWNYVASEKGEQAAVTYWMNSLQPLATDTNLFVSVNATRAPEAGKMKMKIAYAHPIFNSATFAAQKKLWSLQGQNHTWFCGAHFGAGFHEDGLQAGLAVAEQLGGVVRPWNVANHNDRIFAGDTPRQAFLEAAE